MLKYILYIFILLQVILSVATQSSEGPQQPANKPTEETVKASLEPQENAPAGGESSTDPTSSVTPTRGPVSADPKVPPLEHNSLNASEPNGTPSQASNSAGKPDPITPTPPKSENNNEAKKNSAEIKSLSNSVLVVFAAFAVYSAI